MEKKSVKLNDIKLNKDNPRIIRDEKFERLLNSILVFPKMLSARPIVVDNNMVVLGGNQRLKALQEIAKLDVGGLSNRLTSIKEYDDMSGADKDLINEFWSDFCLKKEIEILVADDWNDKESESFIIKDNANFGDWDYDVLSQWDKDLLEAWGVDDWEGDDIEVNTDEAQDDEFDVEEALQEEPICQVGDIYELGEHRLMCGDSTKREHVQSLVRGDIIDLFLSDPPYNVNYNGKSKNKKKIMNDNFANSEDFLHFLADAFLNAYEVMRAGGSFYIWHASAEVVNFISALEMCNFQVKQQLIWNKNSLIVGRQDYQWKHEPCLYGWKKDGVHCWHGDRKQTTVIDFNGPAKSEMHPTMKPIGLMGIQITNSTLKGERVLDLFGGSGSTLMACEQLGRKCYTMEFDPRYADVIINRWESFTGKKAKKI